MAKPSAGSSRVPHLKTVPAPAGPPSFRPRPPVGLDTPVPTGEAHAFAPDLELAKWLMDTFIARDAWLRNDDHAHLQGATIACLWTNLPNARNGRVVIGQCEMMPPTVMGKWQRGRALAQIEGWFGSMPNFLLTFYGPFAAVCSDVQWMALAEHELSHAGQEVDQYGAPKFHKGTGLPVFGMKAHDIEGFIGVARRYGAIEPGVAELVAAIKAGPTLSSADVAHACGTCMARAA